MQDKLEKLIKLVYKKWKSAQPKTGDMHPDEETLACFLENRLSEAENEGVRQHLISCDRCAEVVILQAKLKTETTKEVPGELLERVKELVISRDKSPVLEILLKLKRKALEILSTTGDVLIGQELVPAPVLRSRKIKDFKDEVNILKDFKDIRVEAKVENKGGQAFNLVIIVKQRETQKIIKDLRITLFRDDLELESYLTSSGSVTFEHVLLGRYKVEISTVNTKVASILLDIKV